MTNYYIITAEYDKSDPFSGVDEMIAVLHKTIRSLRNLQDKITLLLKDIPPCDVRNDYIEFRNECGKIVDGILYHDKDRMKEI